MALTDPQSITISGTTTPLPRVFLEARESSYTSADGLIDLSVNHTLVKRGRNRHLLRLDHSKITSNPFDTSQNMTVNLAMYLVIDTPPAGYTATEVMAIYTGFKTLFTASSDATITKLLGGES
jgi:hypothetical protein